MIYASLVAAGAERIDAHRTVTAHRQPDRLIASVYFESPASPGAYLYVQHTSAPLLVRALVGAALDLCQADAGVCDAARTLLADALAAIAETESDG